MKLKDWEQIRDEAAARFYVKPGETKDFSQSISLGFKRGADLGYRSGLLERDHLYMENLRLRLALRYYASGNAGKVKPEKAHLYEKDYPMDSPEWRQRSMSDFDWTLIAKEALRDR